MKKFISLVLLLLFISPVLNAQYDPVPELNTAFANRCGGRGAVTDQAITDGSKLREIVEKIRNDKTCSGVTGALDNLSHLDFSSILQEKLAQDDVEFVASQVTDLDRAIKYEESLTPPDLAYIALLKVDWQIAKLKLLRIARQPKQEKAKKRLNAITNFSEYSNNLFTNLNQSQQCLNANPNLPAQVGAQMLSLSSSFAPSLMGSLLLGAGNLISNFVDFFKTRGLGTKIKVLESAQLGSALGCSIEGLATTYCQAHDVQTIVNAKEEKPSTNGARPTWREGLDIIEYDKPAYNKWISDIDAAAPPGTTGRASDRNSVEDADNDVSKLSNVLDGILNTAIRTYKQKSDPQSATKNAINDLAAKMVGSTDYTTGRTTSPLSELFPDDRTCGPYVYLYSRGATRQIKNKTYGQDCAELALALYPNPPDLKTEVEPLVKKLIAEAKDNLRVRLLDVKISNPTAVLADFVDVGENRRTAEDFLNATLSYLNTLLEDKDPKAIAQNKLQRDLIEKTKKQILEVYAVFERSQDEKVIPVPQAPAIAGTSSSTPVPTPTPPPPVIEKVPADPAKKVYDLSQILIPSGDTFALATALEKIVDYDIDQKIKNGDIDQNLANLIEISTTSGLREFIKNNSESEKLRSQIRNAESMTEKNLTAMGSIFSKNIKNYLEVLSADAKKSKNGQDDLALFCMQTLAVPEAPKLSDVDIGQYCKGTVYANGNEKSGLLMNYDTLSKSQHSDRVCAVYDFYRKSHLQEMKERRMSRPQRPDSNHK